MNRLGKVVVGLAGSLVALAGIGWVGLQVPPQNFPPPSDEPEDRGTVAAPTDLPAPVRRYLATVLGAQAPRIESALFWGRARANFGLWMPLRFRLYHRPGYDFQRTMEVTWFGLPVIKAIDQYLNGQGMTGPVGKAETGPKVDQGSNMILWAEAPLMPSLWVTDPRIRWEAIDETSARLLFPFGTGEDELTVHFDSQSGLITRMSALRYRGQEGGKIPWHVDFLEWQTVDGVKIPFRIAVVWEDQGRPWSYWTFEGVAWNVATTSNSMPTSFLSVSPD